MMRMAKKRVVGVAMFGGGGYNVSALYSLTGYFSLAVEPLPLKTVSTDHHPCDL